MEKRGTLQVVLSYTDENGKNRQKWRDTKLKPKGNKKRAEKIRDEFLKEFEEQLIREEEELLNPIDEPVKEIGFFDYLVEYLETCRMHVEETTYIGYKKYLNGRIKDFFEPTHILLKDLKPRHLQKFYQSILDDKCTANTVIHYHAFIRKALQEAIINELIEVNVADRVKKPKRKQFISQVYNQDEVLELLDAIVGEKIHPVVLLTAFYGLRRSEVIGLRWSSIDFVNKKITINHVVIEDPEDMGRLIKKDRTKNDSSYRTLPLVESIEKIFVAQARWQENNRRLLGKDYKTEDSDYVFTMEYGSLMKPQYLSHRLQKLIKRYGLKKIRFHDLRHSNASIMLDNGQNMKEIQEWLGHASYSTTANLYTHLTTGTKDKAANNLENIFGFAQNETKKNELTS